MKQDKKTNINNPVPPDTLDPSPFAQLLGKFPEGTNPVPDKIAPEKPAPAFRITKTKKGGYPIFREKRSAGKTVTIVHNLSGDTEALLTLLKKRCAAGGKAFEGTIRAIFPAADAASRSFTAQVALAFDPAIRSGMFSRVILDRGTLETMLIPATALIHQGQLTGIFLLDADQIARFRILRTGRTSGVMVEALSGIRPGDRFVVMPPPDMVDGLRVEVPS